MAGVPLKQAWEISAIAVSKKPELGQKRNTLRPTNYSVLQVDVFRSNLENANTQGTGMKCPYIRDVLCSHEGFMFSMGM